MSTPAAEMVRLARHARELTQGALAERADVTQSLISKLENGFVDVDDERLRRIADALEYPVALFRIPARAQAVTALFNRKLLTTPAMHRQAAEARVNLARLNLERILGGVELEPGLPFPKYELAMLDGDIEEAASLLRQAWRVPMGPVRDATALVEAAGAAVVTLDFGSLAIDAASQWPRGGRPYLFLRPDLPGDRWRFNLMHEVGHMVLHDVPTPEAEPEAHRFAGAFLMPAEELRPQIPARLTLATLLDLKLYWRVSMQAIVMRAFDIDAITERQKRSFYQQINARGMRRREPGDIPRETPTLVESVIAAYLEQMGYSLDELGRVALLRPDEMIRQFAPGRIGGSRLHAV